MGLMCFGLAFLAFGGFSSLSANIKAKTANRSVVKIEKYLSPLSEDATVSVAIMPFKGEFTSGTARAEELLSKLDGISLVDRNRMEAVMKEHAFQNSDWADEKVVARVGKALNAQYLAIIEDGKTDDANIGLREKESSEIVSLSLVNVTTLRKFSFPVASNEISSSNYYSGHLATNIAYKGFDADKLEKVMQDGYTGVPLENLDGDWFFDGTKESTASYNAKTLDYLTPFASGYTLKKTKLGKEQKAFKDIEKAVVSGGAVSFVLSDGTVLEAETAVIKEKPAKIVNTARYEGFTSGLFGARAVRIGLKPYSTNSVGTLRARYSKDFDINGTVFYKDDTLAIQIGTSKDDGTGKAYFLMFSR